MSGPDAEDFFMWGPKCTGLVSHQALGRSETRDSRIAWLFSAKESESTFPNTQDGLSEFWVDAEGRLLQYQSQSQLTSVDSADPKEESAFITTSVYFDIGHANEIKNPILALPIVIHEVRPDTYSENIADLQGATFRWHSKSSEVVAPTSGASW